MPTKTLRSLMSVAFIFCMGATGAFAGMVTGKVVNSQGKPLEGVKVRADHTVFPRSFVAAVTDAQGRYTIKLDEPPGTWQLKAEMIREYNDEVYKINLRPDLDEPIGNEGGTRDFTWKLTGRDANGDEIGGWVYVHPASFDDMMAKDVEITFTPDGPLIDGSEGKVITAKFTKQPLKIFPVGRYRLKARHVRTGEPLLIQAKGADEASFEPVVMFPANQYDKRPDQLDLNVMRAP